MVRHGLPISTKKCHSPDLSANVKGHVTDWLCVTITRTAAFVQSARFFVTPIWGCLLKVFRRPSCSAAMRWRRLRKR